MMNSTLLSGTWRAHRPRTRGSSKFHRHRDVVHGQERYALLSKLILRSGGPPGADATFLEPIVVVLSLSHVRSQEASSMTPSAVERQLHRHVAVEREAF
eukprot:1595442-Heterocapsa_arctica.AAC.1